MPVFHHEMGFTGVGNLADGRQTAIRKDVFVDPRVDVIVGSLRADGVQQEDAVRFQIPIHHLKIGSVVFRPDVLEHADGNDPVKLFVQITVILQPDIHIEALAAFPRHFLLFR